MIRYLLKRIAAMVPTLLGITLITFGVITLAPGDPVQAQFGTGGAGAGEEGGGGDQDRLADAVKAKKQLLGIMAEDHRVLGWSAQGADGLLSPTAALGLDSWARALASVDGRTVVGDEDGGVTGLAGGDRIEVHDEAVWALAVSGDQIASADKRGAVAIHTVQGERIGGQPGKGRPVRALAYAEGRLFAVGDAIGLSELDPTTGTKVAQLSAHNGAVYGIAAHGGRLYTGGLDRRLITVDLATFTAIGDLEGHGGAINDIAMSPDGTMLATASDDRVVRLFDLVDGLPVLRGTLEGHYKQVTAVAFSPDGATVFSGGQDELVRSFDVATGDLVAVAAESTGRIFDLAPHEDGVVAAGAFWRKVPVWRRYATWLGRLATFDFGRSFVDDELVMDKIASALPITLGLNLLAILIIYGISVPVGIYAAVGRGGTFDNVSSLLVFVLYSIPNFWLATLLIMMFSSSKYLDWFPSGKLHAPHPWDMSFFPWLLDFGWHLVLPLIVMVYAGFASLSRYVRTSMLEALSQDFVRTARAKGLSERVVVLRHALRNALITIITLIGNLLPRMIGGSVIVEYIFSIDGMGRLGFDAILSRDYPVIMAITTFAAVLTLLGILVSDLLYGAADPRVRVAQ